MAIVSDRKIQYQKEIELCESRRDLAARRVSLVTAGRSFTFNPSYSQASSPLAGQNHTCMEQGITRSTYLSLDLCLPLLQIQSVLEGSVAMEDSSELPTDPEELQAVIEEAETRLTTLQDRLSQENCKRERYKVRTCTCSLWDFSDEGTELSYITDNVPATRSRYVCGQGCHGINSSLVPKSTTPLMFTPSLI